MLRVSMQKKLLVCLCILYLGLLGGCGDSERVVIDFEKTQHGSEPVERISSTRPLKVAVAAMVSPKETFDLYLQTLVYIGEKLGIEIEFVQRKTYAEVNELLGKGDIDLAFICSGPYVFGRAKYGFELVAAPLVHGEPFYRAYLIVHRDSSFQKLEDLRGRTFAFTDPDSNTGKLVPTFWLAEMNETPESYFNQVSYTYSHDNSILAVTRGLIDGATVDGLIWDYFKQRDPDFVSSTRIIRKSRRFGTPPLVVSKHRDAKFKESIKSILFSMHLDSKGQRILSDLMIERFVPAKDEWYDSIRDINDKITRTRHATSQVNKFKD